MLPYKRSMLNSWKSEYIFRSHLIRKWEKGRGAILRFSPKIGSLDTMFVDFDHASMVAASAEQGLAVRCNPTTGKLDKQLLFSTDDNVPLGVNALKMNSHRILWGFNAGFITMSTCRKMYTGRQLRVFSQFHHGPVTALALPSFSDHSILSAGEDSVIKIWDTRTATSIVNLNGVASKPVCLNVSPTYVIAGYANGDIVVWDIELEKEVERFADRLEEAYQDVVTVRATQQNPSFERRVISAPGSHASVTCIKDDPASSVVIVSYENTRSVYKYDIKTGRLLATFGHGHTVGTVSCMKWDMAPPKETGSLKPYSKPMAARIKRQGSTSSFSAPSISPSSSASKPSYRNKRLLVTGDTAGTICMWDGDAVADRGGIVKPLKTLYGHTAAISALYVDACKIVSGADDGWIRIWDPLTGLNINTLGNKIAKHAPVDRSDVNIMRVKNIWCNDFQGVATIGHDVKSWDFSSDKQLLARRQLRPKSKSSSTLSANVSQYELRQELKESKATLQEEKQERDRAAKLLHKLTLGGLSDEEMLEYALMLSKEEAAETFSPEEASRTTPTFTQEDYIDENDQDLVNALIASLSVDDATATEPSSANTPPDAPQAAPCMSQIRAESANTELSAADGTLHGGLSRDDYIDDEDDEALQYVLRLSRGDL
ncbi:WD40-repeat-containing domain protein [Radiomyces spectabilis]|uniref:WD40-repeat-containing domain protein n=1 Tax=Radiomyces spectabilis TaxID=64574 RepID=UPI00222070CD|nr:WD40-repeat-containing domain protein [Radiomyces spectabilis]KAI8381511.1 WD40-repeat-containing domain protein [Radiomyces spectabilis]